MSPILILGVLGGLIVLVLIVTVLVLVTGGEDSTEERLEAIDFQSEWQSAPDTQAEEQGASARDRLVKQLENRLQDRGFAGGIRARLRKANVKLTVAEYLLLRLAVAAGLAGVGWVLWNNATATIPRMVIMAVIGMIIPPIYVNIKRQQRLNQFNEQLADILGLWVNALRAGFSVPQAMEAVSREAPPPASEEFKRVVAEIAIGVPMQTALDNMLSRVESDDLDLVFTAVNIQREVGGNLSEILETISHTIRERVKIKGEVRVLTAQGRITGLVIGLLPILLGAFLYLINPSYMGLLFFGPEQGGAADPILGIPCGWPMIAVGLTMMSIGIAIIRKIVDIEV